MNTDRQKIQSVTIDRLRPLLALMVVGLHVRPYYTTGHELFFDGVYEASVITIFRILFSVAVPFFFLISGYYFFKGLTDWDTTVWKNKIKKRAGSLLVPYLLWNLIAFIGYILTRLAGHLIKGASFPDIIAELNERGWLSLLWNNSLYGSFNHDTTTLFGWTFNAGAPMDAPTWFLRDLMIVILFTPIIWWLIRHLGKVFIIITGLLYVVDLWIPVSGFSSTAFFMFSIGAWLSITGKDLVTVSGKKTILQTTLSILLLIVSAMALGQNEWLYCISSRLFIIFAIPTLFRMVSKIQSIGAERRFIHNMPNSSFFVYLLHTILITDALNWVILSLVQTQNKAVLFVLLTVSTLIVYLVCHIIWLVMNRYTPRFLNLLTGNRSCDRYYK